MFYCLNFSPSNLRTTFITGLKHHHLNKRIIKYYNKFWQIHFKYMIICRLTAEWNVVGIWCEHHVTLLQELHVYNLSKFKLQVHIIHDLHCTACYLQYLYYYSKFRTGFSLIYLRVYIFFFTVNFYSRLDRYAMNTRVE